MLQIQGDWRGLYCAISILNLTKFHAAVKDPRVCWVLQAHGATGLEKPLLVGRT